MTYDPIKSPLTRQAWVTIQLPQVPHTHGWKKHIGFHVFLGRWLPRSFCCLCQGETLNFLPSDWICEVKFAPIQTPSVSVSSFKPECLTKICVLPKQQKTQSGTQAKLICEFKRTSLKKPSVLKKLPAHVNVSVLWGTVHLKVWRTFSQDGDSASEYETKTMYFAYLIICLSISQKLFLLIPQQYPVRLVVGKKNQFEKSGARQDVSFNCLAHLQKNTADVLPQDVSVSASSSRRKAREKISSPPECHLTALFLHQVLKQTRNMDIFGGIVSKTSSTLTTWNVVNNEVFHGQNPLIRPGHHNNTLWWARQLQIVASFINGKTTWWSLLFEAQKKRPSWTHFVHHGHVIARKHKDLVFSS